MIQINDLGFILSFLALSKNLVTFSNVFSLGVHVVIPGNRKMQRLVAIFMLVVLVPLGTAADELRRDTILLNEQAMFKNWGVGAFSCTSFVEAREFPDSPVGPYDATFRQWLMGFATAFNLKDPSTADLLGRTSVERAMSWIEGYCRKNGDKEFFAAVWEFTKMAYPHRVKPDINIAKN